MIYWYIRPTWGGVIQKLRKTTEPMDKSGWQEISHPDQIELLRSDTSQLRWDENRRRLVERHHVTLCKDCDFFKADGVTEAMFTVSGVPENLESVRVILNRRIVMLPRGEPLAVVASAPGVFQFGLVDAALYASPDAITITAEPLAEEITP